MKQLKMNQAGGNSHKYCIVNGDDFGAGRGINRGIMEAHRQGILTSTSLMVNQPAAAEAARISHEAPRLSVGLHVQFTREDFSPLFDFDLAESARNELARQWQRFESLMDQPPTHLDAHHNIYRDPRLRAVFVSWAKRYQVPLREHSPVKYFSSFYGQWDEESHPEQISVEQLGIMLEQEVVEGFTELSCHPGYIDDDFQSSYATEREIELQTLCNPIIRQRIDALGIELINYRDFKRIYTGPYNLQVTP